MQKVISHPQALAQCNSYLKSNDLVGEAAYDTAGSAKLIAEGTKPCQTQQGLCIILDILEWSSFVSFLLKIPQYYLFITLYDFSIAKLPGPLKGVGAICSELAAEHFGLEVLEKGSWSE